RLVWNRQHFVKDPDTGKRQARPNPPEDWITEEVPHLRIISDDQWTRVKQRQGAIREDIFEARASESLAHNAFGVGRRPTHLFSGLLKCGWCGAGYTLMNKVKYGCSAARNRGTCENRQLIHREQIEERVLTGLRDKLLHPDLLAEFIAEFQREVQKERLAALSARGDAERKLTKVTKEIDNIVTAITAGMFHPSMKEKMDGLEAERTQLEAQLAATPAPDPIALHPGLADVYRQKVSTLAASLSDDATRPEAIALLRGLISEIRLHPDAG
ncbi:hypothetical protein CKO11_17075, partial [Rhodobacter sp. TJ_12]|uniref:recombinase zinc beta ribbon domain-containing protein n=1 Tax=Rhodobacter sp. TJ_12 TaxID=2029399 RepID=UPI001CBF1711